MSEPAHPQRHVLQAFAVTRQLAYGLEHLASGPALVIETHRRAATLQYLGVLRLMVVSSERKWHEDRWLARRCKLGHCACTGPANNQIGLCKRTRHVCYKRHDLALKTGR